MIKALVACEESQATTMCLLELGVDAWSCLWLHDLPKLVPINIVKPEFNFVESCHGSKLRSKTSPGLAFAMANQFISYMEVFCGYDLY